MSQIHETPAMVANQAAALQFEIRLVKEEHKLLKAKLRKLQLQRELRRVEADVQGLKEQLEAEEQVDKAISIEQLREGGYDLTLDGHKAVRCKFDARERKYDDEVAPAIALDDSND